MCTISPQQKQTLSNQLISFDYFLKRCNLSGEIMYKSLSEATVIFGSTHRKNWGTTAQGLVTGPLQRDLVWPDNEYGLITNRGRGSRYRAGPDDETLVYLINYFPDKPVNQCFSTGGSRLHTIVYNSILWVANNHTLRATAVNCKNKTYVTAT